MAFRLVLMGPAGSGKTTVGKLFAARHGIPFVDGDALHPAANIAKMARGEALSDADRAPWLDRVAALLSEHAAAHRSIVIACSALKRSYRDRLREAGSGVRFALLTAPRAVLEERVRARADHYMPTSLVADQCDQLEPPAANEHALLLDATMPVENLAGEIAVWVGGGASRLKF
ncbi:MAG: gluconokinase [Alphaproteobacteria bacterium]|nr:gluconokinase [Alphaproteobacteria bacterium]